jgi:hypothetical protein
MYPLIDICLPTATRCTPVELIAFARRTVPAPTTVLCSSARPLLPFTPGNVLYVDSILILVINDQRVTPQVSVSCMSGDLSQSQMLSENFSFSLAYVSDYPDYSFTFRRIRNYSISQKANFGAC